MSKLNYVKYIYENEVSVYCEDQDKIDLLRLLNAKKQLFSKNKWILKYDNKNDLTKILQILNDNNFMFLGGCSGWNPVDVFVSMREQNLVTGSVIEISWINKNQTITRTL